MDLEAINLTKRFGNRIALDNVSFRFSGPGAIGYLGPNGAGKTTTLKIFSHLLRPTYGKALINGIDVADGYAKALESVSALVETPEPYPKLSIKDFLTLIGGMRGLSREETTSRIAELKEKLSLEDLAVQGAKLSKGHKQRVALAATLMSDTDIMLLDEPTTGLDPAETYDVKKIIKELKRTRLVLMSSHLLDEVTELCDSVAFINKGRLLLTDTVKNVTNKFGKGKAGSAGLEDAYLKIIKGG